MGVGIWGVGVGEGMLFGSEIVLVLRDRGIIVLVV